MTTELIVGSQDSMIAPYPAHRSRKAGEDG